MDPREPNALLYRGNVSSNHTGTSDPDSVAWFAVSTSINIVGAITNLLLVIAVFEDHSPSKGPRLLMLNLSITRLLISDIFIPAQSILTYIAALCFIAPAVHCGFLGGYVLTLNATGWSEVALMINRVVAVCFPHSYAQWKTVKVTLPLIVLTWLVAVFPVVLIYKGIGASTAILPDGTCTVRPFNTFGRGCGFLATVIPYSLVGAGSLLIFTGAYAKLRHRRVTSHDHVVPRESVVLRKRLVIAKAMFCSLIWCLVSSGPVNILISNYGFLFVRYPALNKWVRIGTSVRYAVDPLIYFAVSPSLRQSLPGFSAGLRSPTKP